MNSSLGNALYRLLPCDVSWHLLSDEEKAYVHAANLKQNVEREDFANVQEYGEERRPGGDNWRNAADPLETVRGRFLQSALESMHPQAVLEIGPGGGFYTRQLCEFHSVSHYTGVDIGQAFLDFLKPFFDQLRQKKPFESELIQDQVPSEELHRKYDFILLYSVVHHIPNRRDLLSYLGDLLNPGGKIVAYDPAHYLPRILELCRHFVSRGLLKREFFGELKNMSTHHFCSLGEYKRVTKGLPLDVVHTDYVYASKLAAAPMWVKRLLPWLSIREVGVVLEKRAP